MASFNKAGLSVKGMKKRNVLPDHRNIQQKKAKINLTGGIKNFDPKSLS